MTTTEEATAGLFVLAKQTPFTIAPERADELWHEIIGPSGWALKLISGEANFWADVEARTVYASSSGLASLWCLSLVAFLVIDMGSHAAQRVDPEHTEIDIGAWWRETNLGAYVEFARRLCHKDEPWPEALCLPDSEAAIDEPEGRLNNLFLGALSWILLHEIGHIHHKDSHLNPASIKVQQEYKADAFATQWILEQAESGLYREFRVFALCTALSWLLIHGQEKKQGYDHPSTILRIREAVAAFDMGADSYALEYASYMLKVLFDPSTSMKLGDDFTAIEAFEWMCIRLETLFPAYA